MREGLTTNTKLRQNLVQWNLAALNVQRTLKTYGIGISNLK